MTCELPTTRPLILAHRGVVTSGHYLASAAGLRILHEGGNAIDAAAAMCFCLNLLEPPKKDVPLPSAAWAGHRSP